MASWIAGGTAFLALLATAAWLLHRQAAVLLHTISEAQPRDTPLPESLVGIEDRCSDALQRQEDRLNKRLDDLTLAVADGIDHVDRNEKRVRGIVLGAKRRFEASEYYDPGVDAEADTLPLVDEGEREPEELRLLPEGVATFPERGVEEEVNPWDSVPGGI